MIASWQESDDTPRQFAESKDITMAACLYNQGDGLPSGDVQL